MAMYSDNSEIYDIELKCSSVITLRRISRHGKLRPLIFIKKQTSMTILRFNLFTIFDLEESDAS